MSAYSIVNKDVNSGVASATLIMRFKSWTRIIIQPTSANAFRIAVDKSQLETPAGNGLNNGIKLSNTLTPPFYSEWWAGELWAIADAPGAQPATFDLQVIQQPGLQMVTSNE